MAPDMILSPVSTNSSPTLIAADHADETKLHETTQQIKATLTELINCESVKHDDKFRQWVQARLMDAEQELRRQRRRRSSIEREALEAMAL